jgi:uncharacterized membrane protein
MHASGLAMLHKFLPEELKVSKAKVSPWVVSLAQWTFWNPVRSIKPARVFPAS